ncbi:MAG: ATP-binding cassette domain-containing protein, partial [Eubacteriales bacterium]|nr:ATP-binding cassette domain-containing protein [Eubacteriales bacterium]
DEQLRDRMGRDQSRFDEAFADLTSAVMGDRFREQFLDDRQRTRNAVDEVLRYYHLPILRVPESVEELDDYFQHALRPLGVMKRRVALKGKWYRDAIGPMLGTLKTGEIVALLPKTFSGYTFTDPQTGERVSVNARAADRLEEEAYCFYKPFAQRRLTVRELLKYIASLVRPGDAAMFLGISLLVTLAGLLAPAVNQLLFGVVIPSGNEGYLLPSLVLLVSVTVGTQLLSVAKGFISQRLTTRISLAIEPAAMERMLGMPATFFRHYNAGGLSTRLSCMQTLCESLVDTFSGTLVSAAFSLIYLLQIGFIAPPLLLPAMASVAALTALNILIAVFELKHQREAAEADERLTGLVYALFSGVTKIKLAGAEKRGFAKWAEAYREQAKLNFNPPRLLKYGSVLSQLITSLSMLAIYYSAVKGGVSVSDYMAFTVSFGMISAAMLSLAQLTTAYASLKPQVEMVRPLLETMPEVSAGKTVVRKLQGNIELTNVSFRYEDSAPEILRGLNLHIKPHEYVAIVGRTGCGKSTLMRLLLGFEKPVKGAVYFDGQDASKLDLRALRRRIGVVTQDGKLFAGDIYSNIAISAPELTLEGAWEAARMAGLEQDIQEMPMGMSTIISEGGAGLSGGQRQRLMIARALAAKPDILLFDEATSALDNITQKHVADEIAKLNCTRIVIAHRLSTIRDCDRILVLSQGTVAESGTFDELIARKGEFYALAMRQLLHEGDEAGRDTVD